MRKKKKKVHKIPKYFFPVEKPCQQAVKSNCFLNLCFTLETKKVHQSTSHWKMMSNREISNTHFKYNLLKGMANYTFLKQLLKNQSTHSVHVKGFKLRHFKQLLIMPLSVSEIKQH